MDLALRATGVDESDKVFKELSACVSEARSLTDVVKLWLQRGRTIACMRSDTADEHVVGISFDQDRTGLAVGLISTAEVFRLFPQLQVIPGEQDETQLDDFVEQRNERLGVEFSEETGKFMAPAGAMQELVFSYALAEKGFGQIELTELESKLFLELFLVILGPSGEPDWGEMIYIDLSVSPIIQ